MKPFSIKDKSKIKEFIGYLDKCKIKKKDTLPDGTGWSQQAVFYNDDNKETVITFGNFVVINNTDYTVVKNNITPDKIDSFLRTINPSWKK